MNIAHAVEFLTCADDPTTAKIRLAANATADAASWTNFIKFYEIAYGIALKNK